MVAVEQLQETCLRTRCAFGSAQTGVFYRMVEVFKIEHQVLNPQACPFSHRHQLRGLKMRKSERRQTRIFLGEFGERIDNVYHLLAQHYKSVVIYYGVGIVRNVTAGRAQMDYGHSRGTLLTVGVDVSHNVVAHDFFPCPCHVEVDVGNVLLHLRNLFVGNIQSQLLFAFGKSYPQLAPEHHAVFFTEIFKHGFGCVTCCQRIGISCHIFSPRKFPAYILQYRAGKCNLFARCSDIYINLLSSRHPFGVNSVTFGGIVNEYVGHRTYQFSVLDNGASAHTLHNSAGFGKQFPVGNAYDHTLV